MASMAFKKQARLKRKKRIRKKVTGTEDRPRLTVFRSNKHIYAQVIDDAAGATLAAASSVEKDVRTLSDFENKTDLSAFIGKLIARRAMEKGVKKVVFDRNGFMFHGRVKAVSSAAKEAGLEF